MIKKDFPNVLETKRLILKQVSAEDAFFVNQAIIESYKQLNKWMLWCTKLPTLQETEQALAFLHNNFLERKEISLAVFAKDDNRFIGMVGVHNFDWSIPCARLGYWCKISEQGNGFVTEGMIEVIDFCFKKLELKRLNIWCDTENIASAKVAERLNFRLEGIFRGVLAKPGDKNLRLTKCFVKFFDD